MKNKKCKECDGSGSNAERTSLCSVCKGSGHVKKEEV